jgi:hypothetical protein
VKRCYNRFPPPKRIKHHADPTTSTSNRALRVNTFVHPNTLGSLLPFLFCCILQILPPPVESTGDGGVGLEEYDVGR